MEASRTYQLLEGRVVLARTEKKHNIYYVEPQEVRRDEAAGYQVSYIGRSTNKSTRCVLLLGETGAGKTTFVNAAVNYLFGVQFEDSFRLKVKEEVEDGRPNTASQTDSINAYVIYHTKGMKHPHNFVFVDTPGLADTRGAQRQQQVRSRLDAFLISQDVAIDELHYVGLVAKANTNRDLDSQRNVLGEITSLLGNSVPEIICTIATYASDRPAVDDVVRNAGIVSRVMFPFDNGTLYPSQAMDYASSGRRHDALALRWQDMTEQYDKFFTALIRAKPVPNRIFRERKLFDTCKNTLKEQIIELATLLVATDRNKQLYKKYAIQEAENTGWKQEVTREQVVYTEIGNRDDFFAHNCKICQQTCHTCCGTPEREVVGAAVCGTGALAGGAVTATAAETAAAAGATAVAAETAAAAGATAVAAETAAAAGATAVAAETGTATGAFAAVATKGAALMATAGVLTVTAAGFAGYFIGKAVAKSSKACKLKGKNECEGCHHLPSEHFQSESMMKKVAVKDEKVDQRMKDLFDEAVNKKKKTNENIKKDNTIIARTADTISANTVKLVHHGKRIQDFTSQVFDYTDDVTRDIRGDPRVSEAQGGKRQQASRLLDVLREAMGRLASSTAEQVLGRQALVRQLLQTSSNNIPDSKSIWGQIRKLISG